MRIDSINKYQLQPEPSKQKNISSKGLVVSALRYKIQGINELIPSFCSGYKTKNENLLNYFIYRPLAKIEAVKQINKLTKIGVENFKNLFTTLDNSYCEEWALGDSNNYLKALMHLSKDIPQIIKNNDLLDTFIKGRSIASYERGHFLKEAHDFYNELAEKNGYQSEEDLEDIAAIVALSSEGYMNRISPDYKKFVIEHFDKLSVKELKNFLENQKVYLLKFDTIRELETLNAAPLTELIEKLSYTNLGYFDFEKPTNISLKAFIDFYKNDPNPEMVDNYVNFAKACSWEQEGDYAKDRFDFILENIKDEKFSDYIAFLEKSNCFNGVNQIHFDVYKTFLDNEWDISDIDNKFFAEFDNNDDETLIKLCTDKLIQTSKDFPDIIQYYLGDLLGTCKKNKNPNILESFDNLVKVINYAVQNKNLLRTDTEDVSDRNIMRLIKDSSKSISGAVELIGLNNYLYKFKDGLISAIHFADYLYFKDSRKIDGKSFKPDDIQELIEIINVENSKKYKNLKKEICELKNEYKILEKDSPEILSLQQKINTATKELNTLMKNSIKDPQVAFEYISIYKPLWKIGKEKEILPYLNAKTNEDRKLRQQKLNELLLDTLGIKNTYSFKTLERINLENSKYLPRLFEVESQEFKRNFKNLLDILENSTKETIAETLNEMKQNQNTRRIFNEEKINYDKWIDELDYLEEKVFIKTDIEQSKSDTIKNLENDLNSDIFKNLPNIEKKKLINAFEEQGISLVKKDGKYCFLKDNKPIIFEDLKTILHIFKHEMNTNDFWSSQNSNNGVDELKELFKDHILNLRYNELKKLTNKDSDKSSTITIKKIDMNNIEKALFLGDDAACCTSVKGCNAWSAPNYIMTKAIQAIEVKDEKNSVGNTMCYLAKVDGKTSLILDNIELKPQYQFNESIKKAIINFAKKLCKEIGTPDIDIYAGPERHKVNFDEKPLKYHKINLIGDVETPIYIDGITGKYQTGGRHLNSYLYKIS